jgi:two-component system, NarL family, sensor histidine kinase UhpB
VKKAVIMHTNITDRKILETSMKKTIDRYEFIAKATCDTVWEWDIKKDKMFYNSGIENMFGYTLLELVNVHAWWEVNLHPQDAERVLKSLHNAFHDKLEILDIEYRYKCSDGSFKHIHDRSYIVYDESKEPIRMIGSMQDVSYQREEQVRINKTIIETQEAERQQISMELHDNVNQILGVVITYLSLVSDNSDEKIRNREIIDQVKSFIGEAIDEIRKLSHRLAPASLSVVSLRIQQTSMRWIIVMKSTTLMLSPKKYK